MYPWHSIPGKRHGIVEVFFRKRLSRERHGPVRVTV